MVTMPNFSGYTEGLYSSFATAGTILFWGILIIGGAFAFMWLVSFKHRVIILGKSIKMDKAKKILKRDGTTEFKFMKGMAFKKGSPSIPSPNEDLAYSTDRGRDTYFYVQKGDYSYHVVDVPKDFNDEAVENFRKAINEDMKAGEYIFKKRAPLLVKYLKLRHQLIYVPTKFPEIQGKEAAKVVASDFYNWHINRLPRNTARFQKTEKWKEWMLPLMFIVLVVMICITLWVLFKELPKSISVSIVQETVPGFS